MATAEEIELEFYETFFFSRDLEPYPVQEEAFNKIFAGDSVLVAVPTGTGKTMMAKAGIFRALRMGQRAVYTTPLRALTEEKYRELCEDFGDANVGFATGDFKINRDAPIQVEVAEILWNRIFGDRSVSPADIVIMDETHYFNDRDRGYVWEQSIIGLDPRTQLVCLSATVGRSDQFCHWVELTRRLPMQLVESHERRVPLYHEYRESYLIEVVRELAAAGDIPALIFVFGRERCFDTARLLKSCRRFTSDDEKARIEQMCDDTFLGAGVSSELRSLFVHGIGIHHAGILPRYKQLVEKLALERLVKFVVCTETIAAGINLPAKRVIFPSLRKYIRKQARLVTSAEYHQMAGRAGRPQFDDEGIAIVLGPEEVVQDIRKEIKTAKKKGHKVDEERIRRGAYTRALADARRRGDVTWDGAAHTKIHEGQPAELRSTTRINAEQVLAIGLPDLTEQVLPGSVEETDARETLPVYMRLDIATVVDNLLLSDRQRRESHKLLAQVTDNLRALGIVDEHGRQVEGEMVGELNGMDGVFIYYLMMNHQLDYDQCLQLIEYLVDHSVIQRKLDRKDYDKRRDWIKDRLRELRQDNSQVTWEDVEEEYERKHPPELSEIEQYHQIFCSLVPHPQLHGGGKQNNVWATMEEREQGFMEFVDINHLAHEEGSLFSYLIRVMNFANTLGQVTKLEQFASIEERVRACLVAVDSRLEKKKPA